MAGADKSKLGYRILLGVVVLVLGGSMLLYLVPQSPVSGEVSTDTVAKIGDESVSVQDVRQQLNQIEQRNPNMKPLEGLYAQQILKQLVFQKEIEYEAKRLGIGVSDQEQADRIRQYVPTAYNGGQFVGRDRYSAEVQARFQLTVPVFEELIRQGLLEEKFRKLVTDGISVGPAELQDEFRYKNEKVKLDYALIKPEDLESKISPDEAEIRAAYEKNKSKYQVPERRVAGYALVDVNQFRQNVHVSDDMLKVQYQANIQQYQVPNRVQVERIVFMTGGKTDAEVEEIRKKAEDVLKQARKGGKFEDLAKKYSEDAAKDKGGDIGWIGQGQALPEYEKAAFSLPVGSISDLVRTQIGIHIIKVRENETAHTKPFEEGKESLRRAIADLKREKSAEMAKSKAEELARRVKAGEKFEAAARALGLEPKTSDPIAHDGSIPGAASGKQVAVAFHLKTGDVPAPLSLGQSWLVYRVAEKTESNPADFDKQKKQLTEELLQSKRSLAFEAFRTSLDTRLKQEGKLKLMPEKLKSFGTLG